MCILNWEFFFLSSMLVSCNLLFVNFLSNNFQWKGKYIKNWIYILFLFLFQPTFLIKMRFLRERIPSTGIHIWFILLKTILENSFSSYLKIGFLNYGEYKKMGIFFFYQTSF